MPFRLIASVSCSCLTFRSFSSLKLFSKKNVCFTNSNTICMTFPIRNQTSGCLAYIYCSLHTHSRVAFTIRTSVPAVAMYCFVLCIYTFFNSSPRFSDRSKNNEITHTNKHTHTRTHARNSRR